jgi:hypothetical protein
MLLLFLAIVGLGLYLAFSPLGELQNKEKCKIPGTSRYKHAWRMYFPEDGPGYVICVKCKYVAGSEKNEEDQ